MYTISTRWERYELVPRCGRVYTCVREGEGVRDGVGAKGGKLGGENWLGEEKGREKVGVCPAFGTFR